MTRKLQVRLRELNTWLIRATCRHAHIGAHSARGAAGARTCPDCFAQVVNPWYPASAAIAESRTLLVCGGPK